MEHVIIILIALSMAGLGVAATTLITTELAVILLGISLCTALLTGMANTVWFGVGVWLVFISGLLVLFLFFCAVTPDTQIVSTHWKATLLVLVVFITTKLTSSPHGWDSMEPMVFVDRSYFMLLWLVGFLLSVMVVVVKATPTASGAMREPSPRLMSGS